MRRPHGCLIALLIWFAFGAVVYNLPATDREGDGAGVKFIGVTLFATVIIAVLIVAIKADRRWRRGREARREKS